MDARRGFMNWWMCAARTIRYDFIRPLNRHDFASRSRSFMADPIDSTTTAG